jgi:hypothetical protein
MNGWAIVGLLLGGIGLGITGCFVYLIWSIKDVLD